MTHRNFKGVFPEPGKLDAEDRELMDRIPAALDEAAKNLESCRFRLALSVAMGLSQEANRYLDVKEPWRTRRTDLERTATTLWVCLNVLSCLRTITYPFLPFSAQRLHEMLGYDGQVQDSGWRLDEIPVGKSFAKPRHLFRKLTSRWPKRNRSGFGRRPDRSSGAEELGLQGRADLRTHQG